MQGLIDIEISLLAEGVFQCYGVDFRDYGEASFKRRILSWLGKSGFATLSEAQSALLRDKALFKNFLNSITVNVSDMFRDPLFFKGLRTEIIPHLKTYPFVKIWVAGCSTGEEAYSIAITLREEGIPKKFRIYATDINTDSLTTAKDGIYPLSSFKQYTFNYQKSGGTGSFSDYYSARYEHALLDKSLRENIVFSEHNLAGDTDFGEMHLIVCRNVLIYFNSRLKSRAFEIFDNSLVKGGFLCLGMKESLDPAGFKGKFEAFSSKLKIYQKRYEIGK